jgi:hypothetical protein
MKQAVSERAQDRSMTFSSSRTLPGHSWAQRAFDGLAGDLEGLAAERMEFIAEEMSDKQGNVVVPFAQGGNWMGMTLRR